MKNTTKQITIALGASSIAICSALNASVWTAGHGDIGFEYKGGGEIEPHWHLGEDNEAVTIDGSTSSFGPDGMEFEADDLTAQTDLTVVRDADSAWDFIGVSSGADFYVFPEPQDPSVPYLGIGTEELNPSDWTGNLTLTLIGFTGPGQFSLYTVDGFTLMPTAEMRTDDGIGDTLSLAPDDHLHFNWAFSALGNYELTFQITGAHTDGAASGTETFGFSVVPEPSSAGFILAAAGLLCALGRRRRVGLS